MNRTEEGVALLSSQYIFLHFSAPPPPYILRSSRRKQRFSISMALNPKTRSSFYSGISPSDQWCLTVITTVFFGIFLYMIFGAVTAAASQMLRKLLVISPLLLLVAVHWISSGWQLQIPIPGSEPESIHRAGGSPWGVASVLLLLYFLIYYQPSLLSLIF